MPLSITKGDKDNNDPWSCLCFPQTVAFPILGLPTSLPDEGASVTNGQGNRQFSDITNPTPRSSKAPWAPKSTLSFWEGTRPQAGGLEVKGQFPIILFNLLHASQLSYLEAIFKIFAGAPMRWLIRKRYLPHTERSTFNLQNPHKGRRKEPIPPSCFVL